MGKKNDFFEEIKRFGFLNGKIIFGDYTYNIELLPMRVFDEYIELTGKTDGNDDENSKQCYNAFQHVCNYCLYREITKKTIFQKIFRKPGKITRLYDFDLGNYPYVLCDKFINDMFKVLIDKTFFHRLMGWEVEEQDE